MMFCDNSLLYSAGLTHQEGFAEVATGLLRDLLGQLRWEEQTLFLTDSSQDITNLANRKTYRQLLKRCHHSNMLLDHLWLASSVLGRGTLMARQRLRIGPMTLEVDVEHKMRRHVLMYFSIVRRKACWASFVSLSTSVSNTTERQKVRVRFYNL